MKIIELLNKIANGEEIKAKLKFKLGDIIINYYGMNNYSHTPEYDIAYIDKGCTTHDFTLGTLIKCLNDEVEIIEEDKKIDKSIKWYLINEDEEEELKIKQINMNFMNLREKIQEIIEELNGRN